MNSKNAVGLANIICIMSNIVLVLISATASLYIGQENIMNTRFKTEFSATSDETTPEIYKRWAGSCRKRRKAGAGDYS